MAEGSNTAQVLFQIAPGATINLASDKGYWLVNTDGAGNPAVNFKQITMIERNTGRQLNTTLNAVMHLSGKDWSSITYINNAGTNLYICEDTVDVINLFINNYLPSTLLKIMNGIDAYINNAYTYMSSVTFSSSTLSDTIFYMPQNDPNPYTLFVSSYNATTGETDTLTVIDINNNTYLSVNITNVQNQKIILPISWSNASHIPHVVLTASGVTSPTGTVVYTIYRGVVP
jgi:hypothetical protein